MGIFDFLFGKKKTTSYSKEAKKKDSKEELSEDKSPVVEEENSVRKLWDPLLDYMGEGRRSIDKNVFNKNGLNEWYYEDGKQGIEKRFYQKNGKWHGELKEYWENGNIGSEGNYKDGIQDGLWKEYYENGQLKWEGEYTEGEVMSYKSWDENGKEIK